MRSIKFLSSKTSPLIEIKPIRGQINISGRSISEDTHIWSKTINWLKEYQGNPSNEITLNIQLDHLNTSGTKQLLILLRLIDKKAFGGIKTEVNWTLEEIDEDMYQSILDLNQLIKFPINIKKITQFETPLNYPLAMI